MSRPVSIVLAVVLALAAVEALAYGWMHPAPAGLGQPVLCYRPLDRWQGTGKGKQKSDPSSTANEQLTTRLNPPNSTDLSSSYTLLPEVVAKSLPSLNCTTGTAARIDRDDGVIMHLAFFEWDLSNSVNVLEAFRHLPEECLGSIGMTLTGHQPPRAYQVDGETLVFDHTVFRAPGGIIVHAFKGTWISGASNLLGNGLRGGGEQWRQLHWMAALKRFRPAHARVAQGAVRGIPNPDLAWRAYENAMLVDLKLEPASNL